MIIMGNILTVDIGNTNIATCLWNETDKTRLENIPTNRDYSEGELRDAFLSVLRSANNQKAEPILGSVVSCVVPSIAKNAIKALSSITEQTPILLSSFMDFGINFDSYDTKSLGADRVADVAGAISVYGAPVIVCDLGSCTTITAVDMGKRLIGGTICPGVQMSLDTLNEKIPQLPKVTAATTDRLIGNDTASSLLSGAIVGCAGLIEKTVRKISKLPGMENATLVLTGGNAPYILPHLELDREIHYEPDLIMNGLFELYTKIC